MDGLVLKEAHGGGHRDLGVWAPVGSLGELSRYGRILSGWAGVFGVAEEGWSGHDKAEPEMRWVLLLRLSPPLVIALVEWWMMEMLQFVGVVEVKCPRLLHQVWSQFGELRILSLKKQEVRWEVQKRMWKGQKTRLYELRLILGQEEIRINVFHRASLAQEVLKLLMVGFGDVGRCQRVVD